MEKIRKRWLNVQILKELISSENDTRILIADDNLAIISDIGRRKQKNQDFGKVAYREDGAAILIVADGVSNSQCAKLAAKTAVESTFEYLMNSSLFTKSLMSKAIGYAHENVCKIPYDVNHRLDEPETTIVAALIKNNELIVGWVGDSRAYSINGTECKLLTKDDSWCNMAIEKGLLKADEVAGHPKSHIITQCLGTRKFPPNIHTTKYKIGMKNGIVLCTDGLWSMVDMIEAVDINNIAELISWKYTVLANRMGGHDNITVATWLP